MRWRVVVEVGGQGFGPDVLDHDGLLHMRIDSTDAFGRISHDAWRLLSRFGISTSPPAAIDFFRLAAAVYSADLRIPRKTADDGWGREIELHLPVMAFGAWREAREAVEKLLRFLTGDSWHLVFTEANEGRPRFGRNLKSFGTVIDASAVCLLSGGLDSFIGAADALARGEDLYLVSHNSAGGGKYTSPIQDSVVGELTRRFGDARMRHLQFNVSPPTVSSLSHRGVPAGAEDSMRSRSIIFMGLGVLVAASLDQALPLYVPENGFITINPPLTASRVGSHSTRTTHPHTVALVREVLTCLGVPVDLVLDYRFKTKGEMLLEAVEPDWVGRTASRTVSCGKSNFVAMERGSSSTRHCGFCVPCIVRRAALSSAGAAPESYVEEVLSEAALGTGKAADLRALKAAIRRGLDAIDVLSSGPIPPLELPAYLAVARRGLEEIEGVLT